MPDFLADFKVVPPLETIASHLKPNPHFPAPRTSEFHSPLTDHFLDRHHDALRPPSIVAGLTEPGTPRLPPARLPPAGLSAPPTPATTPPAIPEGCQQLAGG